MALLRWLGCPGKDAENRLERVLKNSVEQARFAYDPKGRRVEKVAGGVTTAYTYDGEDILREVAGSSTLKYVHGPGIDEPLAPGGRVGRPELLPCRRSGQHRQEYQLRRRVTATRRYDAFGNLELGATNGYAFTARERDSEAGLAYYRARYYDPKSGERGRRGQALAPAGGAGLFLSAHAGRATARARTHLRAPSGVRGAME